MEENKLALFCHCGAVDHSLLLLFDKCEDDDFNDFGDFVYVNISRRDVSLLSRIGFAIKYVLFGTTSQMYNEVVLDRCSIGKLRGFLHENSNF